MHARNQLRATSGPKRRGRHPERQDGATGSGLGRGRPIGALPGRARRLRSRDHDKRDRYGGAVVERELTPPVHGGRPEVTPARGSARSPPSAAPSQSRGGRPRSRSARRAPDGTSTRSARRSRRRRPRTAPRVAGGALPRSQRTGRRRPGAPGRAQNEETRPPYASEEGSPPAPAWGDSSRSARQGGPPRGFPTASAGARG